jgi:hypothetical protein
MSRARTAPRGCIFYLHVMLCLYHSSWYKILQYVPNWFQLMIQISLLRARLKRHVAFEKITIKIIALELLTPSRTYTRALYENTNNHSRQKKSWPMLTTESRVSPTKCICTVHNVMVHGGHFHDVPFACHRRQGEMRCIHSVCERAMMESISQSHLCIRRKFWASPRFTFARAGAQGKVHTDLLLLETRLRKVYF